MIGIYACFNNMGNQCFRTKYLFFVKHLSGGGSTILAPVTCEGLEKKAHQSWSSPVAVKRSAFYDLFLNFKSNVCNFVKSYHVVLSQR